jgi:hypothetical protein
LIEKYDIESPSDTTTGTTAKEIVKVIPILKERIEVAVKLGEIFFAPPNLWLSSDAVIIILQAINIDINLFSNGSVDKMGKEGSIGLTYFEMQKVIESNNNIATDQYSVENGHYYTAGNFNAFEAQLELDILFSKIICKSINLYPKLCKEYLIQEILNCFRDPFLLEEKEENDILFEIINSKVGDSKSQKKIFSEFYKMQNKLLLDNYKLLEKARKREA